MPGVEVVERCAFANCYALAIVECGKLERIGRGAFEFCESLTIINLPSAKIVEGGAFCDCPALTNVVFGKKLESIRYGVFQGCTPLERITIPLKDNMITDDDIFQGCNLLHVDLVEGELHETIDALLWEEWKNDMNEEINSINQI
ncbi:leucine-rich repeat domain-containing protein, partial [Skeletonema marinoi]